MLKLLHNTSVLLWEFLKGRSFAGMETNWWQLPVCEMLLLVVRRNYMSVFFHHPFFSFSSLLTFRSEDMTNAFLSLLSSCSLLPFPSSQTPQLHQSASNCIISQNHPPIANVPLLTADTPMPIILSPLFFFFFCMGSMALKPVNLHLSVLLGCGRM